MSPGPFRVQVQRRDHFKFDITFDEERWEPVVVDEPEPLGGGGGPNAARLLAGAVGNCLAASLLLCLEKSRLPVTDLRATVEGSMSRNDEGRFRIERLGVRLFPTVEGESGSHRFDRCLEIFEDFCVVTQSVRQGIEVDVRVEAEWTRTSETPADPELAGVGA